MLTFSVRDNPLVSVYVMESDGFDCMLLTCIRDRAFSATKVLKDGERVEVNAGEGVVRRLS